VQCLGVKQELAALTRAHSRGDDGQRTSAQIIGGCAAYVRALQKRWPGLTVLSALFVVQRLYP